MTELHQAAAAGDVDGVEEILLQQKCNPNQRDVDWSYKTALHWAAARGAESISHFPLTSKLMCAENFNVLLPLLLEGEEITC